jgi:group II intron reverse transcriptase/maturase
MEFSLTKGTLEEICEYFNLVNAFKLVKKNKGAAGVDKITVEEYEANLSRNVEELRQEILSWTYEPTPVKRVEIPKPNGGTRLLGIPTVKDRVLHTAIKIVLEPIIDPTFSERSYGFRPGRNQQQAVEKAREIARNGNEQIVDIDLAQFFDRINHDRLIHRLKSYVQDKRVLRLIGMILRSGIMINGVIVSSDEGSVQGSPLSPLLSNVVLDELDKELERRALQHCRFADDCNIFVKTERAAERVMKSVKKFIEKKLKLKVNEGKSKIAKADRVKFLAMTIVNGAIAISKKALDRAMEKVKELTKRRTHESIEQTIRRINQWYQGWASYFKMTQYPSQLKKIEAHIRRRLRARFVRQQKRKRHLCRTLLKLGVTKSRAREVYSNKATWALSHTRAVEWAYSNRWFVEKMKQKIFSDKGLPEWFAPDRWVKLV